MRFRMIIIALSTALFATSLAACGQTAPANTGSSSSASAKVGSIEVVDAWTRPAMSMMDTSSDPKATSAMSCLLYTSRCV